MPSYAPLFMYLLAYCSVLAVSSECLISSAITQITIYLFDSHQRQHNVILLLIGVFNWVLFDGDLQYAHWLFSWFMFCLNTLIPLQNLNLASLSHTLQIWFVGMPLRLSIPIMQPYKHVMNSTCRKSRHTHWQSVFWLLSFMHIVDCFSDQD